jgi:FkbM family methyltransferase
MRLRCDLRDALSSTIFYRGFVDPVVEKWVQAWLLPGATYVDVGAHIGLFVAFALDAVGADGRVVAFEPLPENFRKLSESVKELGNRYPHVELHNAAVGSFPGEAPLFGPSESLLRETSHASLVASSELEKVGSAKVVTLDEVVASASCRLLKIDVEGYEAHVLRGASRLLGDGRAEAVLIEINPEALARAGSRVIDIQQLLEGFGYRLYGISDKKTQIVRAADVTEVRDFTDAIYVPR